MKKVILYIFSFTMPFLYGQRKKCYDMDWKEIKCSGSYEYYRILPEGTSNGLYMVKDYYRNGTLQMEGSYSDNHYLHKQGEFKYYYEDGKLSSLENYIDNKLSGEFRKWYPTGQMKYEGNYTTPNGDPEYLSFWFEDGKQSVENGNGFISLKGDDGSFSEGNLKNGKEDGLWKGYMKLLDITYEDKYNGGIFTEGISQQAGKKYPYTVIQEIPYPEKGDNDLRSFVANHFDFPGKIQRKSYSDATELIITIDESGNIFDVTTENIIDDKVKERLIKTVKRYPGKFRVPKIRGISNKQKLRLPIILEVE